jgi:hypothetical protein
LIARQLATCKRRTDAMNLKDLWVDGGIVGQPAMRTQLGRRRICRVWRSRSCTGGTLTTSSKISINLHVVIAHPAADDQHPFIAQGCEGLAKPDMFCGIHAGQQQDLHNRQIGSREDHLQWNENTVIEATDIVIFPGNLLSAQQFGSALSEVRSSRRRKGNRIGAPWKPVVVIEQRWGRIVLE